MHISLVVQIIILNIMVIINRFLSEFIWETPEELDLKLAKRVRNIRKRRSISQQKLSEMSGVSYGSIKRFESTGYKDISEVIRASR